MTMTEPLCWLRACTLDDLPDDEGLRLETTPAVALFRVGEEVFCIDDSCTHETYSLAEGWLEGCAVECLLHQAKFDLRTGRGTPPASTPVRVHPVRVDGADVHIGLPASYGTP